MQLIFGDEENLIEICLLYLNIVVIEFEHDNVLALHLKGSFEIYYSACVDERLAFNRIAGVIFQEFLPIL